MNNFVIYTDSGCDIAPAVLAQWEVGWSSLRFSFTDEDVEYTATDMSVKTFYDRMRAGEIAKTSAINIGVFLDAFEPLLQQGKDILYIGFSSALSTTCNSATIAAKQLMAKYPERTVIALDSLSASAGLGLLVYFAVQKRKSGATLADTAAYVADMRLQICHWVTMDDLEYLKRGGRISPTVAFVGNALGVKPQIHVDNSGSLVNVSKVRGRKKAIIALADKYGALAVEPAQGVVFISHSDCVEDAEMLADLLHTRYGVTVARITDIGTVIGAHTGPGTVALFFVGKER